MKSGEKIVANNCSEHQYIAMHVDDKKKQCIIIQQNKNFKTNETHSAIILLCCNECRVKRWFSQNMMTHLSIAIVGSNASLFNF